MTRNLYLKSLRLPVYIPSLKLSDIISISIIVLFLLMAVLPNFLAPYDPNDVNLDNRLASPTWSHPFGTDSFGRDTLSRVIYGATTSLSTAFTVVAISVVTGTFLGLLSGYFGGYCDQVIMRLVDLLLAFPRIILAIALVGMLGCSLINIVIALSVTWWVNFARIVRGSVLQVKEREFVEGAKLMGGGGFYIMRRHILPNVLSPVIALATLDVGSAILHITGLSFLGLGAQPPTAEWGVMLKESVAFMETAPQTMVFPGLFILLTVLAFNRLGDSLRDSLDPVSKGVKGLNQIYGGLK
ncbi:MAG: nickel transporter permease [Halobacteriota archaeon]